MEAAKPNNSVNLTAYWLAVAVRSLLASTEVHGVRPLQHIDA